MADVSFTTNELGGADPALAAQFERELRESLGELHVDPLTVQIRVDRAADGALERAWIVVQHREWVREWAIALPVAAGDVGRATDAQFTERNDERRQGGRAAMDRRTPQS